MTDWPTVQVINTIVRFLCFWPCHRSTFLSSDDISVRHSSVTVVSSLR